ncbi:MAG: hypothetical protein ACJAYP_001389 [Flavobacterium sp.]|jgi:hypothetical protein
MESTTAGLAYNLMLNFIGTTKRIGIKSNKIEGIL